MAADHNSRSKGRYYDPPTVIKTVVGVTRRQPCPARDEYSGTADALAEAGLLPRNQFPGEPGMPMGSIFLRPRGVERDPEGSWHWMPGHMQVYRNLKGTFRIVLNVSAEERARRQVIADRERAQQITPMRFAARQRAAVRDEVDFSGPEAELFAEHRPGEKDYAGRCLLRMEFVNGPMDAGGARKEMIERVDLQIRILRSVLERHVGPFMLKPSDEEGEDLDEAIETIRRLAHYGRLVRDTAMSARITRYRAAKAAAEDKPLQAFLAKVGQ